MIALWYNNGHYCNHCQNFMWNMTWSLSKAVSFITKTCTLVDENSPIARQIFFSGLGGFF